MSIENYPLVVFTLDQQRYAFSCSLVDRIIRAIEITSVPKESENLAGVINVQGRIIPVIDIRHLLGLSPREMTLDDHMIILDCQPHDTLSQNLSRVISIVVDESNFIEVKPTALIPMDMITHFDGNDVNQQELHYIEKIIKDPEGPIHLINVERLLGHAITQSIE